jgi:flagellin
MGFRINTNIASMNANAQSRVNNRDLSSSLEKLSSGLRINKAADDASGMAIADSLRSQANALGQAISNANDAIGIIQIADKAMDEQIKILDTIKTKATQAAQDGQSTDSRRAIQSDIKQLLEELDNIANSTSYNGKQLLSGNFINKEFQIGAYSNETVKASIAATNSSKIGHVRVETTQMDTITKGLSTLTFSGSHIPGDEMTIESVEIDSKAGTGIGVLAEVINKNSDRLGVRASFSVEALGSKSVEEGSSIKNLTINGVSIGDLNDIKANDSDGRLVATINTVKDETGVVASTDERGRLKLTSADGRAIEISSDSVDTGTTDPATGAAITKTFEESFGIDGNAFHAGRLTLTATGAIDIKVADTAGGSLETALEGSTEANLNLRGVLRGFNAQQADAMGAFSNSNSLGYPGAGNINEDSIALTAGVTTRDGAMSVMDIADSAIQHLDSIRSHLGSVQNQLTATINNISVTQVNVKSAESTIRDVDFAAESANFSKTNILVQSGSYAMSQANSVQQNVLKLLQ